MPSFSLQLTHNEFTFISVIMMIQSGAIWAYMLHAKSQSRAAFYLRIFFALVFWQALVLFVVNGIDGAQAFLPFHNVSLIVAGIALIEFIRQTEQVAHLRSIRASTSRRLGLCFKRS